MEKHAGGIPASRMEGWRDAMVAALSALVAVPSVKGDPAPGAPFGADTKRALDLALAWGRDAGFRTKDLDGMCGWIEAGEGDRLVAAVCHLDVVPAGSGWTGDPFLARVIGGRLVARGAVDDKGPAVSAFFALRELQRRGPPPGVRFRLILGLDEESGSQCLVRYGKTEETPTYGFTPDAEFPVIHAEKGIAHVLLAFPRAAPRPVVPPGALRLDAAQAGSRANMVPGACRLTFACDPVQRADWMALAAGVPAFVLATKRDGPAPLPASVTADADPARFHVDVTGLMAHASMPWDGRNALSAAMALARAWRRQSPDPAAAKAILQRGAPPSVQFGFDAALDMMGGEPAPDRGVPLAALITARGLVLESQLPALKAAGFGTAKVKLGRVPIHEEVARVRAIAAALGDSVRLRLDGNRCWSLDDAVLFARSLRLDNVDYLEEPLANASELARFFELTGMPYALDETLREEPLWTALPHPGLKCYVIKPSLAGGAEEVRRLSDAAAARGIGCVLSGSYESGVGLLRLARLAAVLTPDVVVGLDTARRLALDLLDPPLPVAAARWTAADLDWKGRSARPEFLTELTYG